MRSTNKLHSKEPARKYFPLHNLSSLVLLLALSVLSFSSLSQELLFSVDAQANANGLGLVRFSSTDATDINDGARVSVPLSNGTVVGGSFVRESTENQLNASQLLPTTSTKSLSLDDGAGSVDLHLFNGKINAMTIFETGTNQFYRVILDSNETGVLKAEDSENYFCENMPVDDSPASRAITEEISAEHTPSLVSVQNLQSKPGASNVIYINYWGGSLTGTAWNATYGTPLIYSAYDIDSDPSTFNDTERYRMYHAWLEAAEDYAPFDVNVTTRASVYNATAQVNRSQILGTTTATRNLYNICGSNCGGVAYTNSFGNATDYRTTGWTFNSTIGSMGMTHAHESGHQMGLFHDGTNTGSAYYPGHGTWGPVMGAPFGKPYVQWSKGEYPDANQLQNDYSIINGKLGTNLDDVGDTLATAYTLANGGFTQNLTRLISPDGFTGSGTGVDFDYYKIDLTGPYPGSLDLTVAPRFGLDFSENAAGETNGSNLTMFARLYGPGTSTTLGPTIISEFPTVTDRPNTNLLTYTNSSMASGVYWLRVNRYSPDFSWATGWGNWGHGGQYKITSRAEAGESPRIYSPLPGSTLTGPNANFLFSPGTVTVENHYIYIGSSSGGTQYYASPQLNGNEYEHVVANLPTDGTSIYVTLWYRVGGVWSSTVFNYTADTSGQPYVYAPLPDSTLLGSSDTFYWRSDGVTATDWHVYIGSAAGQRNYFNSGGLPATASSVFVSGLPTDGRDLYMRLWYRQAGASWQYVDTHYTSNAAASTPTITAPWPGASIGTVQTVYWNANAVAGTVERWRVYAGSTYGASDFTFTTNLPADTRSFDIGGWGAGHSGGHVWVRLQWRVGGSWSRTNELYVAGFSPSIPSIEVEPVDP